MPDSDRYATQPGENRIARAGIAQATEDLEATQECVLPDTQPLLTRSRLLAQQETAEPQATPREAPEPAEPAPTLGERSYATWAGLVSCGAQLRAQCAGALRVLDAHLAVALLCVVLALVAIGAVIVYSASAKMALNLSDAADPAFYLKRHLFALGLALLAMAVACTFSVERWRWMAPKLYAVALIMLVLVLIPGLGTELNGARRWFRFGSGLGFQPSDLAKIALVLMLAAHLSRRKAQNSLPSFAHGFLPTVALIAPVVLLIVAAPDFGTGLFVCMLAAGVFIVAGGRVRHLAFAAAPGVVALGVLVVAKFEHVRPRLESYLDPSADASGAGYQVLQGLIAIGAGGPTGVGLGQSRQSLFYLPEMSTDFIFAILAEETGFVGAFVVLALYLALALIGFRIAARATTRFAQLCAAGITLAIVLQAAVNVAVVTAAVPNTGIPLPFISYGGSLTFFYLVGVGVMLSIARSLSASPVATAGTETAAGAEGKRSQQQAPHEETRKEAGMRPAA